MGHDYYENLFQANWFGLKYKKTVTRCVVSKTGNYVLEHNKLDKLQSLKSPSNNKRSGIELGTDFSQRSKQALLIFECFYIRNLQIYLKTASRAYTVGVRKFPLYIRWPTDQCNYICSKKFQDTRRNILIIREVKQNIAK